MRGRTSESKARHHRRADAGERKLPPAHEWRTPMHNTEFEKYPTSGEENVEVDVFWPIQDA